MTRIIEENAIIEEKGSERYVQFRDPMASPEDIGPHSADLVAWTVYGKRVFECEVWIVAEEEGGYTAFAAYLPGVVAQADEAELALLEIGQALSAAVASYLEHDEPVPWTDDPIEIDSDKPILRRWILVNA